MERTREDLDDRHGAPRGSVVSWEAPRLGRFAACGDKQNIHQFCSVLTESKRAAFHREVFRAWKGELPFPASEAAEAGKNWKGFVVTGRRVLSAVDTNEHAS